MFVCWLVIAFAIARVVVVTKVETAEPVAAEPAASTSADGTAAEASAEGKAATEGETGADAVGLSVVATARDASSDELFRNAQWQNAVLTFSATL